MTPHLWCPRCSAPIDVVYVGEGTAGCPACACEFEVSDRDIARATLMSYAADDAAATLDLARALDEIAPKPSAWAWCDRCAEYVRPKWLRSAADGHGRYGCPQCHCALAT